MKVKDQSEDMILKEEELIPKREDKMILLKKMKFK